MQNGWFLMVGFDDFGRIDRLAPANFDYSETSYWIRFGRNFGQINWSVEPRFSNQHNHLTGVSESAWNVNFLVSYFPSPNLTLSFFWNLGDNDVLSESYLLRGSSSFGGSVFGRALPGSPSPWPIRGPASGTGDAFKPVRLYSHLRDDGRAALTLEVRRTIMKRNTVCLPDTDRHQTVKKTKGILRGSVDSMNRGKPGLLTL